MNDESAATAAEDMGPASGVRPSQESRREYAARLLDALASMALSSAELYDKDDDRRVDLADAGRRVQTRANWLRREDMWRHAAGDLRAMAEVYQESLPGPDPVRNMWLVAAKVVEELAA